MDVVHLKLEEYNMKNNSCKICRRLGTKLFLKGEKCFSPKCPMLRRPYPPGRRKRRRRNLSEYNKELREKQKLRNWYNLGETQFKNYVKEVLKKRAKSSKDKTVKEADAPTLLIQKLERRFDNVIFRMGFASSRPQAKQLVSHGHFLVNKKRVNISSYQVKKGDKISISENSRKEEIFKNLPTLLKKKQIASWLLVDVKKLEGEVKSLPTLEEVAPPVEISMIFEFYSR